MTTSVLSPNHNGTSSLKAILVLDDSSDSLNVFHWILERYYNVLKTKTADEAINLCHEHNDSISLIVADILLGSPLSGTQVALEARVYCPDISILFTSGTPLEGWHDTDFENFKTLMSGRVDFLQKPFTAQALVRKVERLLNGDWSVAEMQPLFEEAEDYRRSGAMRPSH